MSPFCVKYPAYHERKGEILCHAVTFSIIFIESIVCRIHPLTCGISQGVTRAHSAAGAHSLFQAQVTLFGHVGRIWFAVDES